MATVFSADPRVAPVRVTPKNGNDFSLRELQELVGGYIEFVRLVGDAILVINEDGKLKRMRVNRPASLMAAPVIGTDDWIVGDAVLCTLKEAGE